MISVAVCCQLWESLIESVGLLDGTTVPDAHGTSIGPHGKRRRVYSAAVVYL